jgi:hypothetical protein
MGAAGRAVAPGLSSYYKGKIEELEIHIKDKGHNLRRLEAQRNELNAHGAQTLLGGQLAAWEHVDPLADHLL